jgi:hypothetical protein
VKSLPNPDILLIVLQDTTIEPKTILFWYKFIKEEKIIQISAQVKNIKHFFR